MIGEKDFEKALKDTLTFLAQSAETNIVSENQGAVAMLRQITREQGENREDFLQNFRYVFFRLQALLPEALDVPKETPHKDILGYIASGLFYHFFRQYIEKIEGGCCCADKARFVVRKTIRAILTEKNLSLYAEYPDTDENKGQQAYWSPQTIQDTDMAIDMFWNWYFLRDYK